MAYFSVVVLFSWDRASSRFYDSHRIQISTIRNRYFCKWLRICAILRDPTYTLMAFLFPSPNLQCYFTPSSTVGEPPRSVYALVLTSNVSVPSVLVNDCPMNRIIATCPTRSLVFRSTCCRSDYFYLQKQTVQLFLQLLYPHLATDLLWSKHNECYQFRIKSLLLLRRIEILLMTIISFQ